jgi:AraC-like DNA-binding protein
MDPLDEVFAAMRVRSALYARLETTAPWGLDFVGGEAARFGLVAKGACWLSVEGEEPTRLSEGDCYVLAHGTRYVLQDALGSATRACSEVVRDHIGGTVSVGGGGEAAVVITGVFTFEEISVRPLLDLMPRSLVARIEQGRSGVLQSVLQLLNIETETPALGSGMVVSRLADIVLIQAIRAHAASGADAGWLAALSDHQLASPLRAIHADPAADWTVDRLARIAGMSRSAFAKRFRDSIGETPLTYLTRWRMFRASCLLRQSELAVEEISDRVGYSSGAAFNKAFKRATGTTPARYRGLTDTAASQRSPDSMLKATG